MPKTPPHHAPFRIHTRKNRVIKSIPDVRIADDIEREEMAELLEPVMDGAKQILDLLVHSPNAMNGDLVATYASHVAMMSLLMLQLRSYSNTSITLRKPPPGGRERVKRDYAYALSAILTKMRKTLEYGLKTVDVPKIDEETHEVINPHPGVFDDRGFAWFWVKTDLPSMISKATTIIRSWSGLLVWERVNGDGFEEQNEELEEYRSLGVVDASASDYRELEDRD